VMTFADPPRGTACRESRYATTLSGVATKTQSFKVLSNMTAGVLRAGSTRAGYDHRRLCDHATRIRDHHANEGVSLSTFDADSAIVFARLRVGATGILYPIPPGGP